MNRLLDYAEKQAEGLPLRLQDIQDKPVTIQSVRFNSGKFGPYAVMTIVTADGEVIDVMTSAMLVVDALEHVETEGTYPVEAKFTLKGRTWIIE